MQAVQHIGIAAGDVIERARLVLAVLEFAFLVRGKRLPERGGDAGAEIGAGVQRKQAEGSLWHGCVILIAGA